MKPVIYKKYLTKEYKDSVNLIQYFDINPDKSLPPKFTAKENVSQSL